MPPLSRLPPKGSSSADRVVDVLGRAVRTMARQPLLGGALVTAVSSSDPSVSEYQEQVTATMDRVMRAAIGEPPPPQLDSVTRILGYVWYATLMGTVKGWSSVGDVGRELEIAARLFLDSGPGRNDALEARPWPRRAWASIKLAQASIKLISASIEPIPASIADR